MTNPNDLDDIDRDAEQIAEIVGGLTVVAGLMLIWVVVAWSRCWVQWPTWPNWGSQTGSPTLIQEGE